MGLVLKAMWKDYREDLYLDKKDMMQVIKDELSNCDNEIEYNCSNCCDIEECYSKACDKANHEFAESCDYGGLDSEEEFWSDLLD